MIPRAEATKTTVAGARPARARPRSGSAASAAKAGRSSIRKKDASRQGLSWFTIARPARFLSRLRAALQVGRRFRRPAGIPRYSCLGRAAAARSRPRSRARPEEDPPDRAPSSRPPMPAARGRFEQFERVDAELPGTAPSSGFGAGRAPRCSCSSLTPLSESSRSTSTFSPPASGGSIVEFGGDLADDVVVADVDVDVGLLHGLGEFALGLFEFARAAAARRASSCELQAGSSVSWMIASIAPADVEVAADFGRRGAVDVGAAFVGQVFDEVADFEPVGRLPGRR